MDGKSPCAVLKRQCAKMISSPQKDHIIGRCNGAIIGTY